MTTRLSDISRRLSTRLGRLTFSRPVSHVYDPTSYARAPHRRYLELYGTQPKEVVLVGMNPGPFGMVQTGVPFGDVAMVRDWMGIEAPVAKPERQHPKRPIEGFACSRSEVSGTRLWGFARERFPVAAHFFERFFVVNYCPLAFLEESGRNRTPDKLPREERDALYAPCDEALRGAVEWLRPRLVVGVGAFAEKRARVALSGLDVRIGSILHPSPASPAANRGWAEQAAAQLGSLDVMLPPPRA